MSNKIIGSVWTLQWSDIISDTVKIEYSIDGGELNVINTSATNHNGPEFGQGYYDWLIDVEPSNNVVIRISDNDYPDMYVDFDPVDIIFGRVFLKLNGSSSNRGISLGINRGIFI